MKTSHTTELPDKLPMLLTHSALLCHQRASSNCFLLLTEAVNVAPRMRWCGGPSGVCTSPRGFGRAATLTSGAVIPAGTGRTEPRAALGRLGVALTAHSAVCFRAEHSPPSLTSRNAFLF